jgi:glycosyltransferase involved in cell wall biosynthesis
MKIAFLTPEYPHPKTGNSGGIGTSIKNLAVGLIAEGCSVHILVCGQKEDAIFEDNGIKIQQIKNVKFKGLSWLLTRKKIEKIINQLHSNKEIDIVEAPDWTGITSFIQPKKCPVVIRLNGSDTYFCHLDNRPVKWINKFHEKRALQKADVLISVSQFTANTTNEVFGLKKEFTIIPNGIDIDLFQNDTIDILDSNIILYFGTLIRKKGLLELPLIFNEVILKKPDAKLVLIGKDSSDIATGNSSTWEMTQQLFTKKALQNVSYLGSVPYHQMKEQIKKATVCVFPSFAEALPVSWIEAMALQKPIIASYVGWAPEIIENGLEGFLVHPKNHKEYAQRILEVLENSETQESFGIAARKKVVLKFSMETIAKQSIDFYKKTISNDIK